MSAPTPAPGDDRPRDGYYPDPSIPGYVRYWNGASWVPGTSRPAPSDGETLSPPPGVQPVEPAPAAPVEETGPHFFDEDPEPAAPHAPQTGPADEPGPAAPADTAHGSRPEPASAWGADRSRQSGFGGDQDRKVSWGAPRGVDPRLPADRPEPGGEPAGAAAAPPAAEEPDAQQGTFVFRRPTADARPQASGGAQAAQTEGTMTFRAVPRARRQGGGAGAQPPAQQVPAQATPPTPPAPAPAHSGPAGPQQSGAPAAPAAPVTQAPQAVPHPAPQPGTPAATPMTSGPGGGQHSWAQQVHHLAAGDGGGQPVAPWKPVPQDPFAAAVLDQAAARPANLGKRLAARLLDTLVVGAVTAAAAVPLGTRAVDHVNDKIDAAKLSGEQVTVWLLDGTTSVYLGIVLGVLLVLGGLYEALPTARWGHTLGKKLFGLQVRDIEGHEPPSLGLAVRRWLVYSVPGLLAIGIVGVLWCLFDRPWRQCWHDKAANTFVAGRS